MTSSPLVGGGVLLAEGAAEHEHITHPSIIHAYCGTVVFGLSGRKRKVTENHKEADERRKKMGKWDGTRVKTKKKT